MYIILINLSFVIFQFIHLNYLIINELINLSNHIINKLQRVVILDEYLLVKQVIYLYNFLLFNIYFMNFMLL